MAKGGVVTFMLEHPPEGWTLEQFNEYINSLVDMYMKIYVDTMEIVKANKLFDIIWNFRDERLKRFPATDDMWLLV